MKQVSIEEVETDLSCYLQQAQKDSVIITREGVAVGIIMGLEDPEDWWEELLLHNPKFLSRVAQARKDLREGKGVSIEEIRAKYDNS